MTEYQTFYQRSIDDPAGFWQEQAQFIDWQKAPVQILDNSTPGFTRWFRGGETNLCHNAIDRHLSQRADQLAMVCISTETGCERSYTYKEMHAEVQRMAAILLELGVQRGDRVLIYMPMIAQAVFAMLACAPQGSPAS